MDRLPPDSRAVTLPDRKKSGRSHALDRVVATWRSPGPAEIGSRVVEVDLMGRGFRRIAMAEQVLLDGRHADLAARDLGGEPLRQALELGRLSPQPW